jgi:hypothetical protein
LQLFLTSFSAIKKLILCNHNYKLYFSYLVAATVALALAALAGPLVVSAAVAAASCLQGVNVLISHLGGCQCCCNGTMYYYCTLHNDEAAKTDLGGGDGARSMIARLQYKQMPVRERIA